VVTEINSDHGAQGGSTLAAFGDRLVKALARVPELAWRG
jgi:hypothetical protein